jgi:mono/diheme cytochrome c family protein
MSARIALMLVGVGFLLGSSEAAAQDIEKGQQVYAAQKCPLCHAVSGKGNAKGPLDGVGAKYKPAELREWIVNAKTMAAKHNATRKPPMKDFSALPTAEVDALVAYLSSLEK